MKKYVALLFVMGCLFLGINFTDCDKVIEQQIFQTEDNTKDESLKNIISKADKDENEVNTDFEEVTLIRVIDGDTILVADEDGFEYKVRLLGVDTPESVSTQESKNSEYGKKASDYTKELLKDYDTVYLEYGEVTQDKYGRTLAYVWLVAQVDDREDLETLASYQLNANLLNNGYARIYYAENNTFYRSQFDSLQANSIINKIGLWQYDNFEFWEDI